MEKQKKKFQMPHTYIIIFLVICAAALMTLFIPLGTYQEKEITYMQDGEEKTKTVLDPDSFEYVLDENGNKVTKAAPLWGTEDFGGQGILNFVFEGMTVGDKNGTAVGIIAFILVVGGSFGIVLRTGAVDAGIMRVIAITKGREILLIPILITSVLPGRSGVRHGRGGPSLCHDSGSHVRRHGLRRGRGHRLLLCGHADRLSEPPGMNPVQPGGGTGNRRTPGHVGSMRSASPLWVVLHRPSPLCSPCAMRRKSRRTRGLSL